MTGRDGTLPPAVDPGREDGEQTLRTWSTIKGLANNRGPPLGLCGYDMLRSRLPPPFDIGHEGRQCCQEWQVPLSIPPMFPPSNEAVTPSTPEPSHNHGAHDKDPDPLFPTRPQLYDSWAPPRHCDVSLPRCLPQRGGPARPSRTVQVLSRSMKLIVRTHPCPRDFWCTQF